MLLKKNIKRLIVIIFLLVFIGVPLLIYDGLKGNPVRSLLMENATKEYLLRAGYNADDWLQIDAHYDMKWNTGAIKGTVANVIFKDEPEEKYLYVQWRDSGEIQQSCEYFNKDTNAYEVEYTEKRIHMVKDCY